MSIFKWQQVIQINKGCNAKVSTSSNNVVFVIGYNYFGELDSINKCDILKLTQFQSAVDNISYIHSGNARTIYKTHNKGLYISGNNHFGSSSVGISSAIIPLTYAKSNNIKQIFTNVCSDSVFIKTKQNKIFGAGRISQLGLGSTMHPFDRFKPTYINHFNNCLNVVDIQSCTQYSIALCGYLSKDVTTIVIEKWAAISIIPTDIIEMIRKYHCIMNRVYVTKTIDNIYNEDNACFDHRVFSRYYRRRYYGINISGCTHYFCNELPSATEWKKLEWSDSPKHIIKIAAASTRYLLLEANGHVWQSEANNSFKLTSLFCNTKIRIKDIKCGNEHNLAIDFDCKLYSWGNNKMGQCGISEADMSKNMARVESWLRSIGPLNLFFDRYYELFIQNGLTSIEAIQKLTKNELKMMITDTDMLRKLRYVQKYGWSERHTHVNMKYRTIYPPQLVKELMQFQICEIECGYAHSYCKTVDNKHYMFGSNGYNECILYDKNVNIVRSPHCFNKVIKRQISCLNLRSVSLGYYNTKIIVCK